MERSLVDSIFETPAVDGALVEPGLAGLYVLCKSCDVEVSSEEDIAAFLEDRGLEEDGNLDRDSFWALLKWLGWANSEHEVLEKTQLQREQLEVLEKIQLQREQHDAWEVQPAQKLSDDQAGDAKDVQMLQKQMELEHTVIQSKHDAMFADYMASNPCVENIPLAVRRAQYSREHFYENARLALQSYMRETNRIPICFSTGKFVSL